MFLGETNEIGKLSKIRLTYTRPCCKMGKNNKEVHADVCCIFRPAFGCCARQTLVQIVIFSVLAAKNLKKQEFCSKTVFFAFHQSAGRLFYSQKTVDQCFGANLKKPVFCKKNCCKFLTFLRFFAAKTLKMTISTSAHTKRWSKYTTDVFISP